MQVGLSLVLSAEVGRAFDLAEVVGKGGRRKVEEVEEEGGECEES